MGAQTERRSALMLKTLGVVEADPFPQRIRNRASRKLAGKPLLEWVVRQATDCERLDRVVVLSNDCPDGRRLAELAPPDVPVVCSSGRDPLARFVAALEEYPARTVVRIRALTPFLDPVLVDRLVTTGDAHPSCDYVGYCVRRRQPAIQSPLGLLAEWVKADALREADRLANDPDDRQQVTRFIYGHPERFKVRLVPAPAGLDREDVRLTIDSEEDWDHVQAIYDALGPERLGWRQIADLLDEHPALRERMAALNLQA